LSAKWHVHLRDDGVGLSGDPTAPSTSNRLFSQSTARRWHTRHSMVTSSAGWVTHRHVCLLFVGRVVS
jgi:hypothetical protein